ncbi:hypothetical protein [Blastococcus sp. CT_GayMR16]|uniref:hypothetical protein n=1 Tax=Blastococcus sp. CT_GayMR16 TaxID=2559607 RepID=UPI00107412F8|nr:hypothetical protein [Blastococcus sp. CT_GayMR16]TFV86282.1 hypothetical protein E4P38_17405 [Blastococcus sp. CT_GayMR16]
MAKERDLEFRVALRGLDLDEKEAERIRFAVQKAALVELASIDVASGYRVHRLTPDLGGKIPPIGPTDGIVAHLPDLRF